MLKGLHFHGRVQADGLLRLEVPTDLPESEVEVFVVIQPASESVAPPSLKKGWPPGFFEETAGSFADEPLERPSQGNFEIREELL